MGEIKQYNNRIELLQGTLDMLILQTLQWGPQHGYGIVQALSAQSGEVLGVETGSLYPACIGLNGGAGALGVEADGDQATSRYYHITASGKKQLASDLTRWERIVQAIGSIIHGRPEEGEA